MFSWLRGYLHVWDGGLRVSAALLPLPLVVEVAQVAAVPALPISDTQRGQGELDSGC